jgi:hypothetical protein
LHSNKGVSMEIAKERERDRPALCDVC